MNSRETERKARPDGESERAEEPRRRRQYNALTSVPLDAIRDRIRGIAIGELNELFEFVAARYAINLLSVHADPSCALTQCALAADRAVFRELTRALGIRRAA